VRPGLTTILGAGLLLAGAPGFSPQAQAKESSAELLQAPTPDEVWKGDLDGMIKRRTIRALVAYSQTFYFLDGGQQRGVTYELLTQFRDWLNKKLKRKTLQVNLLIIPVPRDELIPALLDGRGDIAAANLTITPDRQKRVGFSTPLLTNVKEIVVTGPQAPQLKTLDDLSGKTVSVRKSSSYYESLEALNNKLKKKGKAPVKVKAVDESLEDEDLLEMVNAGLIAIVVVDSHKAQFWAQVFDHITLHPDLAVRTGGQIAWAFRKNSPKLKQDLDSFIRTHRKGTLMGNILFRRYLQDNKWVTNNLAEKNLEKLRPMIALFRKRGKQYALDWPMLAALGYQESGLDQNRRSSQGAVGVMQIRPSTAADKNINIKHVEKLDNNIHAGTKYLRFLYDRYFADEPMDDKNKILFSLAAYNAGPARVRTLRNEAKKMGLDPNVWFHNVEEAAAKKVGRETVRYVSNIYKYYIVYRRSLDELERKAAAKNTVK
jgi:membrane-bound lytic murein transglycosylase MltF